MSQQLEELARLLVIALHDERLESNDLLNQLDVLLTGIAKLRADNPDQIAHAHRIADAFAADFACDEIPEIKQGEGTDVWVQCWMLVKTDPAGAMS